ncbi:hypothetical protein IVW58_09215 [Salmonella enterica subsp. enterica serovar Worthington]|nr:hypothetical protein [Salmonella enterica subsp. enterica serovar Worthington]
MTSQMLCHPGEKAIIAQKRDKNEHSRYLGRKLDDSLPDFVTFVVSRFWNWGKRDNNPHFIVTDKCIAHKNPPKRVFR